MKTFKVMALAIVAMMVMASGWVVVHFYERLNIGIDRFSPLGICIERIRTAEFEAYEWVMGESDAWEALETEDNCK